MEVLVKGISVLIDDEDYELFSKYNWRIDSLGYVRTDRRINKKKTCIRLHRLLMIGLEKNDLQVDHINRNRLDNRRCNLRVCTKKQNNQNTSVRKNSSSNYLGVHLRKNRGNKKWVACCCRKSKCFLTEKEAALYYNELAIIEYGEFANLNIID